MAGSRRRYTIRSGLLQLSAACAIPAILVALALLGYDFWFQRDRAYSDAMLIARNVASDVDTEVSTIESGLRILATSAELQSGDLVAFHRRAVDALRFQGVVNYALSEPSGRQLVNTFLPIGAALATNRLTPELRRVFDERATVVSGLFTGPVSGQPVVAVGVPVQIGSGVPYALGAGVHVERLGGVLRRQALRESWIVAVLDAKGTILARSRDAERFVGQTGTASLVDAATRSPQGTFESITKDGTPVFTAFVRAPKSNWIIAVGLPKAQLMGALYQSLTWLLAGGALAIGGGLWLASRLARQLSAAVRGLVEPALALGSGRPMTLAPSCLEETDAVADALRQAGRMLARAQHQAHHDALTGMCNRALFDQVAQQQISLAERNQTPLAILLIDLDGFKAVNDTHGHAAGDLVLKIVAERIAAHTRGADIRARLGGDEFAVLLSDSTVAGAEHVANKLVQVLAEPFPGVLPAVSASIGLSHYPSCGNAVAQLLEQADRALYVAKSSGKRRLVHANAIPAGA